MPGARLSDIEEVPHYEGPDTGPGTGGTRELESDYYLGGYDVDSECPPPPDDHFLSRDQLPPPLPEDFPEQYEAPLSGSLSPGRRHRAHFHPSQYLPPHAFPHDPSPSGPAQAPCDFSTFTMPVGPASESGRVTDSCRGSSPPHEPLDCSTDGAELSGVHLHTPFLEVQHQTQV